MGVLVWQRPDAGAEALGAGEQVGALDAEGVGDADKVLERDVALASFDAAHVASVDAGFVGEGFLGELHLGAEVADGGPERAVSF